MNAGLNLVLSLPCIPILFAMLISTEFLSIRQVGLFVVLMLNMLSILVSFIMTRDERHKITSTGRPVEDTRI